MPKRGSGRKKQTKSESEMTQKVTALNGKISKLEEINRVLAIENTELTRNVNELLAKIDEISDSDTPAELVMIEPDDLVMVKLVKPMFTFNHTDYRGITNVHITGDKFQMRKSRIHYLPVHTVEIIEG